jgi:hypothetical protein
MSALKRDTSQFRFARAEKQPDASDIEHSQPRQTLELQRAAELWQRSDGRGGDPYNAVGARMQRPSAA